MLPMSSTPVKKRKLGHSKEGKGKKKLKMAMPEGQRSKKVKIDKRMRKLFEKRARDYNSDDEDDRGSDEIAPVVGGRSELPQGNRDEVKGNFSDEEKDDVEGASDEEIEVSEDEDGEIQPGITRFAEGCKAFRMAFRKIVKKTASDDVLGPVLSAHKKLVAEKLAEEDTERKVKGESRKEKQLIREKGHVKPANYLDSREKLLIGIATKGVVKLFNAVNKAQSAQKGFNPDRSKDEKVIKKRRKEAFFEELGKKSHRSSGTAAKAGLSTGSGETEGPAWAPLRDNYMLTNSKLKNWDKNPDHNFTSEHGKKVNTDTSSDED